MKPSTFRKIIHWLFALLVFHLAGFILYSFLLSGAVKAMYDLDENIAGAYGYVLLFQCIYWAVAVLVFIRFFQMSDSDMQRAIRTADKEENFSPMQYFYKHFVVDLFWKAGVYAVFQLPLAIFFGLFGLVLDDSVTFLEKYYISSAGFYGVTGSAFAGILLSTVYLFVLMAGVSYLYYRRILRDK